MTRFRELALRQITEGCPWSSGLQPKTHGQKKVTLEVQVPCQENMR